MAHALLDTGAVALVNRDDRKHDVGAEWFRGFRGTLLTTEAVVTETAYVLGASPAHQRAALLWFERARASGLLKVEPVADYAALARIMAQYADPPCDYADASLTALAEQASVAGIATIDQRDFSVYRVRGRKRFRILLGRG